MPVTTRPSAALATLAVILALAAGSAYAAAGIETVPGMPPVTDPTNLYSETTAAKLSPALANVPARVYVPNVKSDEVHVIDPVTFKVIDRFKVGKNPQHGQGCRRRRSLQHVLHPRRQVRGRRGRGDEAPGLPRSEDHGAAGLGV